jgi:hypothetical protein
MMEEVSITLPWHAIRYLRQMCERDREFLSCMIEGNELSLGSMAAHDSLNAIECALPND